MQDNFELAQNEKLKSEIKRLEKSAYRTNVWSSKAEKGKKMTADMDSKNTIEDMLVTRLKR